MHCTLESAAYKEGMRAEIQALIIKELQAAEGLDFRKCIKARGKRQLAACRLPSSVQGFCALGDLSDISSL